jgi:hypothetical protein
MTGGDDSTPMLCVLDAIEGGGVRLVKWAIGREGWISYLKRGYDYDRTWLDGKNGGAIWCECASHAMVNAAIGGWWQGGREQSLAPADAAPAGGGLDADRGQELL